jgi:hypothetical protein
MPSFGREAKQWVPCRRFVARNRSRRSIVEVGSFRLHSYPIVSRQTNPSFANRGLQLSSRLRASPVKSAPVLGRVAAGALHSCAPLLGRAACGALCWEAPALEQRGRPLELIGGNQSPRRTKGPLNTA